MEITDEAYKKLILEVAAARGAVAPRRKFSIGGCVVWVLAGIMFVVFLAALIPNIVASYPVLGQMVGGAGVTFSTAVAPVATVSSLGAGPAAQPFRGGGGEQQPPSHPGVAPWPTLTPEAAPPTPTAAPYTTKANLGPSSPESNPGFTCGVEPGMPVDATCATAEPVDPEMAPVDIYSVEDRVFQPAVLPTSSTKDNPGFDSSVEPGSMPTPVQ